MSQSIQRFRGINSYSTLATLGPEWAQDLINVVVSGSGGLSKMRLPVPLSVAIGGINTGPNSFWDFQQGNGTRQVLAFFGASLYYFTNDLANATLIENNGANTGQWSLAVANNILFGANGQRMQKWTGTNWQIWGIQPAVVPPTVQLVTFNTSSLTGITLNGTTQFVSTTTQISAPVAFSWEVWFKTSAVTNQALVGFDDVKTGLGTKADRTLWIGSNGSLNFGVFDSPANVVRIISAAGPYNDGALHQACVTITAGKIVTLFVDGVQVAATGTAIMGAALLSYNGFWRIGEAQGGTPAWPFATAFFNGSISHAYFWNNTIITLAQFAAHFNALSANGQAAYEAAVTADNPKYAWKLNEAVGPVAADSADANPGTYQAAPTLNQNLALAAGLSPAFGYSYSYAWKNSVTGHVGNVSIADAASGAFTKKANQAIASPPNPADAQIDTIVWFRSLDGGGDQFRLCEVNLATGAITTFSSGTQITAQIIGAQYLQITDASPDSSIDQATRGPLINNPPVQGNYVALGQSRLFVFNLAGSPQDIIYSGYEQILLGRPEESFPPNNRLRLSIGAEQIAGGGVLQAGVVAFSQTGRMYMLRGQVEDISLAVPVNFSAYLEELPWTLGCASHFTIQSTPYGLIWLAGDKTVQLFDGRSEPVDISAPIYPYLRRITPGTESQCVASYFNWLERDWYVLLAALDGSLTINRMFMFAANKIPQSNDLESMELFVSDIPANLPAGTVPWIGLITTSTLQRELCIASQGRIQNLPVTSDTVNGVTVDFTINPSTAGNLNAFWRGGYFGNINPQRSKLWRWLRLITDQDPKAFKVLMRYVDDEQRTFTQPEIQGPFTLRTSKQGLNHRSNRASVEIDFPAQDAPANVLELTVTGIPTADR
jgi:hypothetical protein